MDEKILFKFISGQASKSEQKEVLAWIEMSEENKSIFSQLKNIDVATNLYAQELKDVKKRGKNPHTILRRMAVWTLRSAAVLALGFTVYCLGQRTNNTKWEKIAQEQITEVVVPNGESVTLNLPDGSKVRLNSGSKLKFSKMFGVNDRIVSLDGEGYFSVTNNGLKFIVSTSDIDVEVLGTKFDVSAFSSDRVVKASLFEGSIRVINNSLHENIIIEPDYSYSYDKVTKKSSIKGFNKERSWIDNYFTVDSYDIEMFAQKVARKYNVNIIIDPELAGKCTYTGSFKGESLKEILDNMALASPIKYKMEGDTTVYIYHSNKKLNNN